MSESTNKETAMSDVCKEVNINGRKYVLDSPIDTDGLVIVRTYSAGVHVGRIESREGTEVILANARRIWRWRGANTLNEAAVNGVAMEWTRISEPVPSITLTQAIEIIPVCKGAVESLTTSRWPS